MSDKIRREHLERVAYVYVRQSTPYQVRNHLESKERQYGLAERARQLGFPSIVMIDEDLGRSGGGTQERPGFGRLLASVCQDWPEPSSLWRHLDWLVTIVTGITWLISVR